MRWFQRWCRLHMCWGLIVMTFIQLVWILSVLATVMNSVAYLVSVALSPSSWLINLRLLYLPMIVALVVVVPLSYVLIPMIPLLSETTAWSRRRGRP